MPVLKGAPQWYEALANYKGADAFKHGYTRASGFKRASAERGNNRIITVVFGGRSIATRNRQIAKLTDLDLRKLDSFWEE